MQENRKDRGKQERGNCIKKFRIKNNICHFVFTPFSEQNEGNIVVRFLQNGLLNILNFYQCFA